MNNWHGTMLLSKLTMIYIKTEYPNGIVELLFTKGLQVSSFKLAPNSIQDPPALHQVNGNNSHPCQIWISDSVMNRIVIAIPSEWWGWYKLLFLKLILKKLWYLWNEKHCLKLPGNFRKADGCYSGSNKNCQHEGASDKDIHGYGINCSSHLYV